MDDTLFINVNPQNRRLPDVWLKITVKSVKTIKQITFDVKYLNCTTKHFPNGGVEAFRLPFEKH